jgi:hypothetical protein
MNTTREGGEYSLSVPNFVTPIIGMGEFLSLKMEWVFYSPCDGVSLPFSAPLAPYALFVQ